LRYIFIALPPYLPARWHKIHSARIAALDALQTQEERSIYLNKHCSWVNLKKWLSQASGDKCWYCEAKSSRAPFDVDHFRPKLGITVNGVDLSGHNGYYWLAYEWWNFRLSCQRCNRPEKDDIHVLRGKANEFPVRDETSRCQNFEGALNNESPMLLDPCVQSDCDLLAHGIDGEVKPTANPGTWEYQRADYAISQLGLNAWNCPEIKRKQWSTLDILIRSKINRSEIVRKLQEHLSCDHEYSSFFRSAIGTHRDKAWIEALL